MQRRSMRLATKAAHDANVKGFMLRGALVKADLHSSSSVTKPVQSITQTDAIHAQRWLGSLLQCPRVFGHQACSGLRSL